MATETKKPKLELVGDNGIAIVVDVVGKAQQAAKKAGFPPEKTAAMMEEMMSGDYDHMLQTLMNYFDVY